MRIRFTKDVKSPAVHIGHALYRRDFVLDANADGFEVADDEYENYLKNTGLFEVIEEKPADKPPADPNAPPADGATEPPASGQAPPATGAPPSAPPPTPPAAGTEQPAEQPPADQPPQ